MKHILKKVIANLPYLKNIINERNSLRMEVKHLKQSIRNTEKSDKVPESNYKVYFK